MLDKIELAAPLTIVSTTRRLIATIPIAITRIRVKRVVFSPPEDEMIRFLRLGLGTCKMNAVRYS